MDSKKIGQISNIENKSLIKKRKHNNVNLKNKQLEIKSTCLILFKNRKSIKGEIIRKKKRKYSSIKNIKRK